MIHLTVSDWGSGALLMIHFTIGGLNVGPGRPWEGPLWALLGPSAILKMIFFSLTLINHSITAQSAPESVQVHSGPGGPPGGVLGTDGGGGPEKDPRKNGYRKPFFGTGVGINKISPSHGYSPPLRSWWWDMGPRRTMLEENDYYYYSIFSVPHLNT